MQQLYSVSGRVTDTAGAPLAGVTISNGVRSTATTVDGSYQLSNLPVGMHLISASRTGFSFSPASHMLNLSESLSGIDFSGVSAGDAVSAQHLIYLPLVIR
jgi:hypothetical protein